MGKRTSIEVKSCLLKTLICVFWLAHYYSTNNILITREKSYIGLLKGTSILHLMSFRLFVKFLKIYSGITTLQTFYLYRLLKRMSKRKFTYQNRLLISKIARDNVTLSEGIYATYVGFGCYPGVCVSVLLKVPSGEIRILSTVVDILDARPKLPRPSNGTAHYPP